MNPRVVLAGGLFILSETLPYLPCKSNGVLHIALSSLHSLKLMPDAQFAKFERASGFDMNHDGVIGERSRQEVQCDTASTDANDDTVITITINKKKV
jgi:hypothetical protein